MVSCKNCGFELDEGAKFCKNCGSEVILGEPQNTNEAQFCSNCGNKLKKGTRFCPDCGASVDGVPQVNSNAVNNAGKNSLFAAILSFLIIGLGQIYIGLTKKGIILFIAAVISGILMLIYIGWIIWLLVWGYAIYDAYNSAEKMNNGIAVEDTIDINNLF